MATEKLVKILLIIYTVFHSIGFALLGWVMSFDTGVTDAAAHLTAIGIAALTFLLSGALIGALSLGTYKGLFGRNPFFALVFALFVVFNILNFPVGTALAVFLLIEFYKRRFA